VQTEEKKYEFRRVFTDSRERLCASHIVFDINNNSEDASGKDTIVLVTDKRSASVSGLYHPPERTYKNAADTLFEACLPHTVVRIQCGDIRPPWRRRATSSNPPTGVLIDDIIGACSEGTIYTFSILSEPARHMLRFLQNLVEEKKKREPANQYTVVKQRTGDIMDVLMNGAEGAQDADIRVLEVDPKHREQGLAGPRHKHVDGDLLVRWRNKSGNLRELVQESTERGVSVLFEEFATVLLPTRVDGEDVAMVERVTEWLDEVLMPVL
jgi:hypothetical protein